LDQNTIGTAVGVAGLVLAGCSHYRAVLVDRAKTKLEDIVSIRLSDIGRSVKDAQDNAGLAYDHFDLIRQYVSGQPSTKEQLEVIDHLSWAQADVVATHRMLVVVSSWLLFGGRSPRHLRIVVMEV
jgi:hypothetical protein